MSDTPICPEPGCGRKMLFVDRHNLQGGQLYECPANPDQHRIAALEATIAELKGQVERMERELEEADRALIGTFQGPSGPGYYDATGPYGYKRNEAVYREALRREAARPVKHEVGCGFKGTLHIGQCTCGALARQSASSAAPKDEVKP